MAEGYVRSLEYGGRLQAVAADLIEDFKMAVSK